MFVISAILEKILKEEVHMVDYIKQLSNLADRNDVAIPGIQKVLDSKDATIKQLMDQIAGLANVDPVQLQAVIDKLSAQVATSEQMAKGPPIGPAPQPPRG